MISGIVMRVMSGAEFVWVVMSTMESGGAWGRFYRGSACLLEAESHRSALCALCFMFCLFSMSWYNILGRPLAAGAPRRVVIMVSVFEALSLMIAFGMLVAVIMNCRK